MDPNDEVATDMFEDTAGELAQMQKDELIPLIINQLQFYGYAATALHLAEESGFSLPYGASARLAELAHAGSDTKDAEEEDEELVPVGNIAEDEEEEDLETNGLVIDTNVKTPAEPRPPPNYTTWYSTQHRAAARCAAFTVDGKYMATGSRDSSIKIIDVGRIKSNHRDNVEDKAVIRTLYDHIGPINELQFHPNGLVLASCSEDHTIKFYDLQKPAKRSFKYFQDSYPVRSISFHPCGEFLLSGTEHDAVRMYDIQTSTCFTPPNPSDFHSAPINCVRYASQGNMFASCSDDGSIKVYDGVSGRCVQMFAKAHSGQPVSSIRFSKNGKYLLSNGLDSLGRLWDLGAQKQLHTFEGATQKKHFSTVAFTSNEDYVLMSDEQTSSIFCWDSRTGMLLKRFPGHSKYNLVRAVNSSPIDAAFVSCGDDYRVKYWNVEL
ncbi:WD40-repeat-containing domain protein [Cladochytrium replicatum]|nr:WD40-repeat-containing domain protein [Cladochytrium replicatum]